MRSSPYWFICVWQPFFFPAPGGYARPALPVGHEIALNVDGKPPPTSPALSFWAPAKNLPPRQFFRSIHELRVGFTEMGAICPSALPTFNEIINFLSDSNDMKTCEKQHYTAPAVEEIEVGGAQPLCLSVRFNGFNEEEEWV